jgi:hypothetical protein
MTGSRLCLDHAPYSRLWFANTVTPAEVRRKRVLDEGGEARWSVFQVALAISASRHRHREAGLRIDHCLWLGAESGFAGLSPQAARRV